MLHLKQLLLSLRLVALQVRARVQAVVLLLVELKQGRLAINYARDEHKPNLWLQRYVIV